MYLFVLVAGLMALYFMAAAWRRPRPADILAVVLWGAYAVYEYFVANGTLCDPYCNIRVDLVLFIPLLAFATAFALQKAPRTGAVASLAVFCLVVAASLAAALGYKAVAAVAGLGAVIVAVLAVKSMLTTDRT